MRATLYLISSVALLAYAARKLATKIDMTFPMRMTVVHACAVGTHAELSWKFY